MEDKNIKQRQFWSGAGGDVWVNKQREMDIMLNPLGERVINKLDIQRMYRYMDKSVKKDAVIVDIDDNE